MSLISDHVQHHLVPFKILLKGTIEVSQNGAVVAISEGSGLHVIKVQCIFVVKKGCMLQLEIYKTLIAFMYNSERVLSWLMHCLVARTQNTKSNFCMFQP